MATAPLPARPFTFIEWSPVIAGTIVALTISIVLLQFGQGVGLSLDNVDIKGDNLAAKFFTVGLWTLWIQLTASIAGAYLAGRTRSSWPDASASEGELRDGAHGLLVWALSTLLTAIGIAVLGFWASLAATHGAPMDRPEVPDELMRRAGIIAGFGLAVSSIVSGVVAWWMGTVGGDHRDRAVDVSRLVSFRKRK